MILLFSSLCSVSPLSQSDFSNKWSRTMVYNWGTFDPQPLPFRDIWQYLETFLVAATVGDVPGIWRPRMLLNIVQCTRQPSQQIILWLWGPTSPVCLQLSGYSTENPVSQETPHSWVYWDGWSPYIWPQTSQVPKRTNPALEGRPINFTFFSPTPFPSI